MISWLQVLLAQDAHTWSLFYVKGKDYDVSIFSTENYWNKPFIDQDKAIFF